MFKGRCMATYTVTTSADVVDAADGVLSLREAITLANGTAAADTIVFSTAVGLFVSVGTSANRAGFEINASGGALTINGDRDDDGQGDIAFNNGFGTKFTVNQGANLTLVGVDFINGNSQATPAANGASQGRGESSVVPAGPTSIAGGYAIDLDGDNILDANEKVRALAYFGQDAQDNTAAGDGADGGAGEKGEDRAGAISNAGTLTLIRVGFGDNNADGGRGGTGGRGGDGGFTFGGRDGVEGHHIVDGLFFNNEKHPLWVEPGDGGDGGNGSQGGNGGDGGAGGAGGHAGGAILNQAGATLSLTDVVFGGRLVSGYIEDGNTATGGNGAQGGAGGWGSHGGRGGNGGNDGYTGDRYEIGSSYIDENGQTVTLPGPQVVDPATLYSGAAGIGGNGGSGGHGGDAGGNGRGGSAAGSILNLGTLSGRAAITDFNSATAGTSTVTVSTGGNAGTGGAGGTGGLEYPDLYVIAFGTPQANIVEPTRTNVASGANGAAGIAGAGGTVGPAGQASGGIVTLGSGTQSVTQADAIVYVHRLDGSVDATDRISFNIIRIGDVGSTLTVNWRVVGTGANAVTSADFVGGALPTGSVTLAEVTGYTLGASYDRFFAGPPVTTAKSVARVDVDLAAAGIGELREGFRIELTSVSSNKAAVTAVLGTAAVTGFVAGIAAPAGPTVGPDSLAGGGGPDSLAGLGGNDTLLGNAGNDTIDGGIGNDSMVGGSGNDRYLVNSTLDSVVEAAGGGDGDYVITTVSHTLAAFVENLTLSGAAANGSGNALNNVLTGNGLANSLSGLGGLDTLVGGNGNDTLDGGTGNDSLAGGIANDTYIVDSLADRVFEGANQGIDTVRTTLATYTLGANVENLVGTNGVVHRFTGNGLANAITGNALADTLTGAAGNDTLDGGAGIDRLVGGIGDDTYDITTGDVVVEVANQGFDTVIARQGAAFTLGANLEALVLAGPTLVTGTGNGLANAVIGNALGNTLSGLAGADALFGEGGADTLIGGAGQDTLAGGAGADQFRLATLADSTMAAPDLITDFTFVAGQLDRISLALIDANALVAGNQAFVYRGANFTGAAGDLRVQAQGGGVFVAAGDVNGDSAADFAITIQSATAAAGGWFIL